MQQILLSFVFFLSGAAALIYQIVWMRRLVLIVGTTSQAVASVLTVFMAGMALGAWIIGRIGDRLRKPVLIFAALELGIGIYGLLSAEILSLFQRFFAVYDFGGPHSEAALPIFRVVLAVAALIVPTTLMGATLPILVRATTRSRMSLGESTGRLYSVNTFGAVFGAAITALVLIPNLGINKSLLFAAALNFTGALITITLAGALRSGPAQITADVAKSKYSRAQLWVVAAATLAGFVGLAYEVLWTRHLIYVLGTNSVYAFSEILVAFLLGIVIGSYFSAGHADRIKNPLPILGLLVACSGLTALLTPGIMSILVAVPTGAKEPVLDYFARSAKCMLALLLPTTLQGAIFPLANRVFAYSDDLIAKSTGTLYATNTIGATIGALAGGLLILPVLGLQHGLLLLGGLSIVFGLSMVFAYSSCCVRLRLVGVIAAALCVPAGYIALNGRPAESAMLGPDDKLVFYRDGAESSVAVIEGISGHRHLVVDGDIQAGTEPVSQIHLRQLAHLPAIFQPDLKKGLIVAYGTGITSHALLQHPLESLVIVEISKDVIEASELFEKWNKGALRDPRVRLVRDDGRNYLLRTTEKFDLITTDPLDPIDAGLTNLYSKEYYELVRSRLRDGGVTAQWLGPNLSAEDFRTLLRTFLRVFPNSSIWFAEFTTVVVGIKGDRKPRVDELMLNFTNPAIKKSMQEINIGSPAELAALLIAGPDELKRFAGEGPLITDDHPIIEYAVYRGDDEVSALDQLLAHRRRDSSSWFADRSRAPSDWDLEFERFSARLNPKH